jgi:hypothetical protein
LELLALLKERRDAVLKHLFFAASLLALLLGAGVPAYAAAGDLWSTGPSDEYRIGSDGVPIYDNERKLPLPLSEAVIVDADSNFTVQITTSTTPGYVVDNEATFVEWGDGEESPVQWKFRVPNDYASGGAFRVLMGRSHASTIPAADFEVFVDTTGTAFDTSATDQTAVQVCDTVGAGSPEEETLTVTTDFASLAAGNIVTLNLWRDNTNASTDTLELYYAEFYYTASR